MVHTIVRTCTISKDQLRVVAYSVLVGAGAAASKESSAVGTFNNDTVERKIRKTRAKFEFSVGRHGWCD